jgi:hypothetical protein
MPSRQTWTLFYLFKRTVLIGGSVTLIVWLSLVLTQDKLNPPKVAPTHVSAKENGFDPKTLLAPVRPIVDAPVVKASEIGDAVYDNELVLGVVVNGKSRAYPINMLCGPRREIVNDSLGNRAIAATW